MSDDLTTALVRANKAPGPKAPRYKMTVDGRPSLTLYTRYMEALQEAVSDGKPLPVMHDMTVNGLAEAVPALLAQMHRQADDPWVIMDMQRRRKGRI